MGARKCLDKKECSKILSLKNDGLSIHAIGRELNRSRILITKFIRNPEEYIKKNISLAKSYEILNNSLEIKKENVVKNDKNGTANKTVKPKKSPPKLITSTPNKKIICKSYGSTKKFSDDEIKSFNRVTVEHRAVIKYLIKKGIGPRFIYDDMKNVYGDISPNLKSVLYWAKQFQQGRQTIINDPANKQQQLNSTTKSNNFTNTSKTTTSRAKQVKLFKFKFKPLKRLNK